MTAVKICGLKDGENLKVAITSGAKFIGFVFHLKSPRFVTTEAAGKLSRSVPSSVRPVGLFVDPTDAELEKILKSVPLEMLQLHGDETPARVDQIKEKHGIPVMKALRVGGEEDLKRVPEFDAVSDWLLFDAKVEGEQGGTGKTFDWNLLRQKNFKKPWMLSGGLNAGNVASALKILQPNAVDISSGVESSRGIKDPSKIREFIEAVKKAG